MNKPLVKITRIEFENLRGYTHTKLSLDKPFISIIGNNNQGKSSVLVLLDFLLNKGDEKLFSGIRPLTDSEADILIPSNNAPHQARRLTVSISFSDLKQQAYYFPSGQRNILRLSVKKKTKSLRLNTGLPRRSEAHDPKAMELLRYLKQNIKCCVIPSSRDSNSEWFNNLLTLEIERRLNIEFHHDKQAGAKRNYRDARGVTNTLNELSSRILTDFSKDLLKDISGPLVRRSEINCTVKNSDLSRWLSNAAVLKLATGAHDENLVPSQHVGSGLQSTLGVVLGLMCGKNSGNNQHIIAVEEPETFLHPSAQRLVSTMLRKHASDSTTILITTHSPIFIEEAKYEEIVIAQNRKYFEPTISAARRHAINSSLMSAANAETFFADCVLFVEGPGDKALFDALFRRLRTLQGGERLWNISIQVAGGNERFAPWIKLMRAYGEPGQRPIKWFSLFDSDVFDDGAFRRTMKEVGYPLANKVDRLISHISQLGYSDSGKRGFFVEKLNRSEINKFKFGFWGVDLEWAMCNANNASEAAVMLEILNEIIADRSSKRFTTTHDIAKRLGSKVSTGKSVEKTFKDPYIRFEYGKRIPFTALPREVEQIIGRVLKKLLRKAKLVDELMNRAKKENPQLLY